MISPPELDVGSSRARDPMSRRHFLIGGVVGAAAALGLTAVEAFESRYVHPYRPELERVQIPVPSAHAGLAGMRIGFITDTHVGPFITPDDLARATKLVAEERPDLILLGGDYISESTR